jgi:acetyl esterase
MTRPLSLLFTLLAALVIASPASAGIYRDIEFSRPDGISLTLDASIPDGPGPFPTVIIVHGGGFARGDKQTYVPPLFEPLSQAGFAWFTINYRLHPQVRFPAPVEDVEAAISFVRAHATDYKVDLRRVVLMGESAGGTLVSFVGVRHRSAIRLAAVVPFYGVHDWEQRAAEEQAGKVGPSIWRDFFSVPAGSSPEAVRRMREVSAATFVRRGLPPFLLIHGTSDQQVNYQQSITMQQRMKKAGNICDLITVEGGPHGMGVITRYPETAPKMIAWLKSTLRI